MFKVHNVNNNTISIKNLILLFLTIVMGFGSVITLAQISIPSSIDNAWQTIMRITITSDGTDSGTPLWDFNSGGNGGAYINLDSSFEETTFSGKVLGIDDDGNLIYTYSQHLIVSGTNGGGGDGHRTGDNLTDIRNINEGKVGIGGQPSSGKLHIIGSGDTDVYIEDLEVNKAANINFKNTTRTRTIGGDSFPDIFYIGIPGLDQFVSIIPSGEVGIGTTGPKANLHVIGNFIAGTKNNTISGAHSSIIAGSGNTLTGYTSIVGGESNMLMAIASAIVAGTGNQLGGFISFIGGGQGNSIIGNRHFIGGGSSNIIYSPNTATNSIIGGGNGNSIYTTSEGGRNFIGGGSSNSISGGVNFSFIGGGQNNNIMYIGASTMKNAIIAGGENNDIIASNYTFIGGGYDNNITGGSNYSAIAGGRGNNIIGATYSFVGGYRAEALHNYSFVRNSNSSNNFSTTDEKTFIINAINGVGIRTNDPQGDLHIAGSGVIVLQPQTDNPQGISGVHSPCTITGSILFNQTSNKLCYCDGGGYRKFIDGNDYCDF